MAARFPDINFVLRPHPDENTTVYNNAFDGIHNLHVVGAGSVHPWIKASLAVIHHDCTTGLEAVMAGKPTISFVPRTHESITAWLPIYVSINCKTSTEVMDSLGKVLSSPEAVFDPGVEKGKVFASYFANFKAEASNLLTSHLSENYIRASEGPKALLHLLLRRLRSRISIVRLRRKVRKDGWDRFIRLERKELLNRLPFTGNIQDIKALSIRIRGGNVAYLKIRKPL